MLTFHFRLSAKVIRTEGDPNKFMSRGEMYIETENGFFPCIGWNDRILSSVSMWIGNTIRMLDPKYGELNVTNYFMDGPYSFNVQKTEKNHIAIMFMRHVGEGEKEELPLLDIALMDYCNALLELGDNIINDPNFHGYGKEQERINFKKSVTMLKAWL